MACVHFYSLHFRKAEEARVERHHRLLDGISSPLLFKPQPLCECLRLLDVICQLYDLFQMNQQHIRTRHTLKNFLSLWVDQLSHPVTCYCPLFVGCAYRKYHRGRIATESTTSRSILWGSGSPRREACNIVGFFADCAAKKWPREAVAKQGVVRVRCAA